MIQRKRRKTLTQAGGFFSTEGIVGGAMDSSCASCGVRAGVPFIPNICALSAQYCRKLAAGGAAGDAAMPAIAPAPPTGRNGARHADFVPAMVPANQARVESYLSEAFQQTGRRVTLRNSGGRQAIVTRRTFTARERANRWLPDASRREADRLDALQPSATPAQPEAVSDDQMMPAKSSILNGEPKFRELEPARALVPGR